jgi:Rad3-related DNA helicase
MNKSKKSRLAVSGLYESLKIPFKMLSKRDALNMFRVHIQREDIVVQDITKSGMSLPLKKTETFFNFWCFSASISMRSLVDEGVKSIILASGTMVCITCVFIFQSPLDSFALELGIPFPHRLENSHVIQSHQIFVGITERGPAGHILSSSFENRGSIDYITDLGHAITNFISCVPDGVLVFFPAYGVMMKTIAQWKKVMMMYYVRDSLCPEERLYGIISLRLNLL